MSSLLEITKQIERASARVQSLERALVDYPGLPSIAANLESVIRVQRQLEAEFEAVAAQLGVVVCRYRAFNDTETTRTAPAFGAIADFQRLVSVVYGALKHGIKQRATIPEEVARETLFGFGFAFTGSLGVVLTIRNQTDLFGDSFLNESIDVIFQMAKASSTEEILQFADRLGPGPINALHKWAEDNADNGLGADVEWRQGKTVRNSLFVQRQELWKLTRAIKRSSSKTTRELTLFGRLQAADASKLRFKFKEEGLREIRGTVEPGVIDEKHTVGLPSKYMAHVLKTEQTIYATGQVKVKYHLLRLQKPNRDEIA
ncbi:MAG TPA: hypothetical protein VGN42_09095 [Pirellulales bacterium]|jgi:hypothetical protein|nr:hypothetical protein [Pirellulales bacterium]